jgi:hypothetical protein
VNAYYGAQRGGRPARIGVALIFTVFAVLGGVVAVGSIAFAGSLLPAHIVLGVITAYLSLRALIWHIRDRKRRFTLDRYPVQADRVLAGSGWHGTAYFGWILGISVYTQMATPLVQALVALAAVLGVPFGISAGIGLGLARSLAPWQGALARDRSDPALVIDRYIGKRASSMSFRLFGVIAALWVAGADVAGMVR